MLSGLFKISTSDYRYIAKRNDDTEDGPTNYLLY